MRVFVVQLGVGGVVLVVDELELVLVLELVDVVLAETVTVVVVVVKSHQYIVSVVYTHVQSSY